MKVPGKECGGINVHATSFTGQNRDDYSSN